MVWYVLALGMLCEKVLEHQTPFLYIQGTQSDPPVASGVANSAVKVVNVLTSATYYVNAGQCVVSLVFATGHPLA